jgi:hypothetical protein
MRQLLLTIIAISIIAIITNQFACKSKPSETPPLETKISGRVLDATTNNPISNAQISTYPTTSSVTSDVAGSYTIKDVKPGLYDVFVAKNGFKTNKVQVLAIEGKTAQADILLEAQTPELSLSPAFIDFGTAQNGATITVSNSTSYGTLSWYATTNASYLSLSQTSGSVTTNTNSVIVTANRTSLAYGNYNTTITFTADNKNKDVPVLLTVQNPNAPQLSVSPLTLDFGNSTNSLPVNISNTGTGTLSWNIDTNQTWLSVNPKTGSNNFSVNVFVNRSGITAGNYNGSLTFTSNGGNSSVNVSMTTTTNTGPYTTDSNTVALYHFDETGGNVVTDVSGYNNNGTTTGTTIVDGKFGKGRNFNGISDFILISNSSSLTPNSEITLECWVKFNSLVNDGHSRAIIDNRNSQPAGKDYFIYAESFNDDIFFALGINGNYQSVNFSISENNILIDVWYHIAGTYDGTKMRIYLNSEQKDSLAVTGTISYSHSPLYIGWNWFGFNGNIFDGLIDEVRISNKARNPSEFHLGKHKR